MSKDAGVLIIYLFTNFICIYVPNNIFEIVFAEKKRRNLALPLTNVAYYLCLLLVFLYSGPGIADFLLNLIFMFTITLCYKSDMQNRIFICVATLVFMGGFEAAIIALVEFVSCGAIDTSKDSPIFFYLVIISKVLLYVCTKALKPLLAKLYKRSIVEIPRAYWLSLLFIPFASLFVIYTCYGQMMDNNSSLKWMACISIAFMIGVTLIVFFLYDRTLEAGEAKVKIAIQEQQLESYITAYRNMQESSYKTFEDRHNLKNIAIGLLSNLDSGNEEGIAKVRKQLEELIGKYRTLCHRKWCNIPIIDAILNTKSAYAESLGIQISAQIQIQSFPVDDQVMCVVLGNALDNAIEACKSVPKRQKKICISITDEDTNLFILVQNPYAGCLQFTGEFPTSSKKDTSKHGYGLSSIARLASQHNGLMSIDANDNKFTLSVILKRQ